MIDSLASLAAALADPLTDPQSRTWFPSLLLAAGIAIVMTGSVRRGLGIDLWRHRSSILDVQLYLTRGLMKFIGILPSVAFTKLLAISLVFQFDRWFGAPGWSGHPWLISIVYTLCLFITWDLSRYLLHRAMHEIPWLWQIHQVHHSAEVLTPLTLHRLHPFEGILYQLRESLVSGIVTALFFWLWRGAVSDFTIFGVHGLGMLFNIITGNLRHSHIWLRFGAPVERWLLSPAQHQIHHSAEPADFGANYGTWLAIWDRMAGSLRIAGPVPPKAFGIAEHERNHEPDQLVSALVGPIQGLIRQPPRLVSAIVLLLGYPARAETPEPSEPEPTEAEPTAEDIEVLIVRDRSGLPRIAGSAHVIDEEQLSRYEQDDIHRVLARVPGIYVRGEDGFGLRPNIGIRGANSDRSAKVVLMEDGVLLAPAPYAAPAAYYFPLTTRMVGIDIFKGPAAIRHGPNTVGGAINLRTRPVPEASGGALDVALGLRSSIKLHGHAAWGSPKFGVLIEGAHLSTSGFKQLDTGGDTGFERQDLMLKGRYSDSGKFHHAVELKLGVGREKSNETYLGLTEADFEATPYRRYAASSNDHMRWLRTQAEASWRVRISPDVNLRTTAYHHGLSRAWTKLNRFADGPDLHTLISGPGTGQNAVYLAILRGEDDSVTDDQQLMIGTNDRRFHSWGVQSIVKWRANPGSIDSELEAGIRLHGDHVVRKHTEDPFAMHDGHLVATDADTLTTLDALTTALAFSAYVQEDLGIGPIHITPGTRIEMIRTTSALNHEASKANFQVVPLPGIGVLGGITPWLDVFGGIHRGFSPAPPGAAATAPESSWSTEAGTRWSPRNFRGELVGFFNDYSNLTGNCTLSSGCSEDQLDSSFSAGKVWVYGLEASAKQRWTLPFDSAIEASASYTWTGSSFRTDFISEFPQFGSVVIGDHLPYVPEHQGAAEIVWDHTKVRFAIGATARTGMRDSAGAEPMAETVHSPGVLLWDVSGEVVVTPTIRFYATATSLASGPIIESWRPFGARPTAPFQVFAGVKVATLAQ